MVNIYLKIDPSNVEPSDLVYSICEHLSGTKAFQDNEIFVPEPNGNSIHIGLGEESNDVLDIVATYENSVPYKLTGGFYLSEENSTGIEVSTKKELLERISDRIDEIINDSNGPTQIEVMIIK